MPARRYNGGVIETSLPVASELCAAGPAPDPASLPEQLATLWLKNAALRAQNTVVQQHMHKMAEQSRRGSPP
jgi:hypothetical protein